jgi:hypothetical protein
VCSTVTDFSSKYYSIAKIQSRKSYYLPENFAGFSAFNESRGADYRADTFALSWATVPEIPLMLEFSVIIRSST